MKKRITRISPLQLGKVLGILYLCLSIIIVPFIALAVALNPKAANSGGMVTAIVMIVILPILYAVMGFLGGLLVGAIYNLIATWSGGIELTLEDVPPAVGQV